MSAARISRWARRYVLVALAFLVAWTVGTVVGVPRRTEVALGLSGFVLHVVFGKAYSLVPTYFDRDLAFPRAPAVQFPLVATGAAGIALAPLGVGPAWLDTAGATLWTGGICVFVGTLAWTVRTNPTGRETATGETETERRPVDRYANAFVPVALAYLLVGTYGTLALATGLPPVVDGYPPRVTHLLAAGAAGVLVLALGCRLLPRFLVVHPPRALVAVVLPAGAVGPALLAGGLVRRSGPWFHLGALAEATAIVGFATLVGLLFARSDRRRVGFYAVLAGMASGVLAVGFGLWFAFVGPSPGLVTAHLRLNLLGFLGLTIVGLTYQFYPPTIGSSVWSSDRTALGSIGLLAGGLAVQVVGFVGGAWVDAGTWAVVTTVGEVAALCGAVVYASLLVAVFRARRRR